jgi:hypothetical protein
MSHATVSPARIRYRSPELHCDVSRRIGWYVRYPNGERGKIRKTRDEARQETRAEIQHDPTQRAEATTTPETRRGWGQSRYLGPTGDGGHDQDGGTGAHVGGVRAEARR